MHLAFDDRSQLTVAGLNPITGIYILLYNRLQGCDDYLIHITESLWQYLKAQ